MICACGGWPALARKGYKIGWRMRAVFSQGFGRQILCSAFALMAVGCATAPEDPSLVGSYLSARLAARTSDVQQAATAFSNTHVVLASDAELLYDSFYYHVAAGDIDRALDIAARLNTFKTQTDETGEKADGQGEDQTDDAADIADADADTSVAAAPSAERYGLVTLIELAGALKTNDLDHARTLINDGPPTQSLTSIFTISAAWLDNAQGGPNAAAKRIKDDENEGFRVFYPSHMALFAEQAGFVDKAASLHRLAMVGRGSLVEATLYGAFLERTAPASDAEAFYGALSAQQGVAKHLARAGLERVAKGTHAGEVPYLTPAQGTALGAQSLAAYVYQLHRKEYASLREQGLRRLDENYDMPLILAQLALYLDPEFEAARQLVAEIFALYEDTDSVRRVLAEIPHNSPQFEVARITVANALADDGRLDEAARQLRSAAAAGPFASEAKFRLATLYAEQGRPDMAIAALDGLINNAPELQLSDAEIEAALARALNQRADDDEDGSATRPRSPQGWRYYLVRASSFLDQENWAAAELDLKRALAIAPTHPLTLNNLGAFWSERGENLTEAFALIEQAVALSEDNGNIIDSLGWAHFQHGNYKEAVTHLERAVTLSHSDPLITDHLGDAYWRVGRENDARYEWLRALNLEPEAKLREQILQKLSKGLGDPIPVAGGAGLRPMANAPADPPEIAAKP